MKLTKSWSELLRCCKIQPILRQPLLTLTLTLTWVQLYFIQTNIHFYLASKLRHATEYHQIITDWLNALMVGFKVVMVDEVITMLNRYSCYLVVKIVARCKNVSHLVQSRKVVNGRHTMLITHKDSRDTWSTTRAPSTLIIVRRYV